MREEAEAAGMGLAKSGHSYDDPSLNLLERMAKSLLTV